LFVVAEQREAGTVDGERRATVGLDRWPVTGGRAGVCLDERGMLEPSAEEWLQLLERVDREELPHRGHRSLRHPLDGLGVGGCLGLGRLEVRGQEVLELPRGDPSPVQILVVETEGSFDRLAEASADLLPALPRGALCTDDAEFGHVRTIVADGSRTGQQAEPGVNLGRPSSERVWRAQEW